MKILQAAKQSVLLAPITAATTARTASLDTQGSDYAQIVVTVGAQANTNATAVLLAVTESDDNTTFSTFNSAYSTSVTNTAGKVAVFNVDLKARKRYLKIAVTPDTTTNGAVISSAIGVLDKINKGASTSNADVVVVG